VNLFVRHRHFSEKLATNRATMSEPKENPP